MNQVIEKNKKSFENEERDEFNFKKKREFFKEYLYEEKGYTGSTTSQYLYYLDKFGNESPNQQNVRYFLVKKLPGNDVARSFLKTYSKFLNKYYYSEIDLTKLLPERKKKRKKEPKIIDEKEVLYLSKKIESKKDCQTKDRDIMMLLISFYSGLRINELLNLSPFDFNWESWGMDTNGIGKLTIRKEIAKGKKQREVYLPSFLMKMIYKYIKANDIENEKIFPISKRRWQKIVAVEGKKYLKKEIHPHTLRHSFATYLLEKGVPIEKVQRMLGHGNISATSIYIHLSKKNVEKSYREIFEKKKE